MPDSFARPGRISNCDPIRKGGTNRFPQAYKYRQEEINYAIARLKEMPEVDSENIFLMGHSEGGIATAETQAPGLKGLIISGWTCTDHSGYFYNGIRAPVNIPALAIAYLDDSWRAGTPRSGRCINHRGKRNLTQVDFRGNLHETFGEPIAKEAVFRFLKENISGHTIELPKLKIYDLEMEDSKEELEEFD